MGSPKSLKRLPPVWHTAAVQAYVHSIDTVFLVAIPITFLAFLCAIALPEIKLRSTVGTKSGAHAKGSEGDDTTSSTAEAMMI